MADEQHSSAVARHLPRLLYALLLKGVITDGQDLVDQENVRVQVRCDGERQPQIHTAGKMLDGCVNEALHFGKRNDFVKPSVNLSLLHAQDRATQVNVLTAGELRVEARANLEKASYLAVEVYTPPGRLRYPRQDFQ